MEGMEKMKMRHKNHRSAELRDTEAASGLDGRHN